MLIKFQSSQMKFSTLQETVSKTYSYFKYLTLFKVIVSGDVVLEDKFKK